MTHPKPGVESQAFSPAECFEWEAFPTSARTCRPIVGVVGALECARIPPGTPAAPPTGCSDAGRAPGTGGRLEPVSIVAIFESLRRSRGGRASCCRRYPFSIRNKFT